MRSCGGSRAIICGASARSHPSGHGVGHEAYLRLVDDKRVTWQDRAHFYGIAARLMRRILVDHARARNTQKRGGLEAKITLDEATALSPSSAPNLVALDDALHDFAKTYPRKSKVVELKFFGGLEAAQIADLLEVSEKRSCGIGASRSSGFADS
jgi:RNA polymerase sigma factor (TIGR02999 family)